MRTKLVIKNESMDWVRELSAGIIRQTIEDYDRYNKSLIRNMKKLKKEKMTTNDLHKKRMIMKRIRKAKRELKKILTFFNSEWYYFLTSIPWDKMKRMMKEVYVNTWGLKKNSLGYLYLCQNFKKKEK